MLDPILLRIAKSAILDKLDGYSRLDRKDLITKYPFLNAQRAAFVTLHYDHNLRGCIGSIIAHQTLLEDIITNANAAAFRDPRFSPLHVSELSHLTLEVSVLTAPEILHYRDFNDLAEKLRPNIDGVILKHGSYQGTFLPQVWDELPLAEEFLDHLSYKAGANPSIYEQHPTIYTYQVDAIEERFDAILSL